MTKEQNYDYRINKPYCIIVDGDKAILVNRNYKNLGNPTDEFADYRPYYIPLKLSDKDIEIIAFDGLEGGRKMLHLYDDCCAPWLSKKHKINYDKRNEYLQRKLIQEKNKDDKENYFGVEASRRLP
jgi:hypothetical protein